MITFKNFLLLSLSITLLTISSISVFYVWQNEKAKSRAKQDEYYLAILESLQDRYKAIVFSESFDRTGMSSSRDKNTSEKAIINSKIAEIHNNMLEDGYSDQDFEIFNFIAHNRANDRLIKFHDSLRHK